MSLSGSLYSAVAGLNVNSMAMSVIGDNIANMNTIGYKRSRACFQDLMAYPVIAVGSESYVGRGSVLQDIGQDMTQGSFANTGNGLDLAITGSGFFVVKGKIGGTEANYYTRAGQFQVSKDGYLENLTGLRVQGYMIGSDGTASQNLTDLEFRSATSPVKATGKITLDLNLSSSATTPTAAWDLQDPANTSNFSTTITVYDTLGAAHDVNVYFRKTANNTWDYHAVVDKTQTTSGLNEELGTGTLSFNSDGKLDTISSSGPFAYTFPGSGAQSLSFDFGDALSSGGTGLAGLTQFASASSVNSQGQDGFPAGTLQSIVVDTNGLITGTFTNGQRRDLGQIALADFRGNGLRRMGSNLWQETTESGQPVIGAANTGTRGGLASSALEQANVDLSSEFVDMIMAQRAFQANSRTITTSDQLIQEVISLKRG